MGSALRYALMPGLGGLSTDGLSAEHSREFTRRWRGGYSDNSDHVLSVTPPPWPVTSADHALVTMEEAEARRAFGGSIRMRKVRMFVGRDGTFVGSEVAIGTL